MSQMILYDLKTYCSSLHSLVFLCILGIFVFFIRVYSGFLPFLQQLTNMVILNWEKEKNPSHYSALKMYLF